MPWAAWTSLLYPCPTKGCFWCALVDATQEGGFNRAAYGDISPCHQLPCLVPASPRVPQQEHVLLSPSVSLAQHISWGFSVPPPSPEPALVLAGIFVFVYSKTFTVTPAPWQLQSVGLMLVCSLELVVRPAGRPVFATVIGCCVTFLSYSGSQSKLNAK